MVGSLKELYTQVTDIDGQLQVSHDNLQKAKRLNDKASAAENLAREELEKTRQAERFIEQAEQVNNDVIDEIANYQNGTGGWADKMKELKDTVGNVGAQLKDVSAQIGEVQKTIEETTGKSTEISVAADAVTHSTGEIKISGCFGLTGIFGVLFFF